MKMLAVTVKYGGASDMAPKYQVRFDLRGRLDAVLASGQKEVRRVS